MKKNIRDEPVDLGELARQQPDLADAIIGRPLADMLRAETVAGSRPYAIEFKVGDLPYSEDAARRYFAKPSGQGE